MNILFANYGDFATNSLNHIAGFANELCRRGHDCLVAVPRNPESVRLLPEPLFIPVTFEQVLRVPNHFSDSRPADIIHAWTPREGVRLFVEAYQRNHAAPVIVHLEDNEERLLETYYRMSFSELRHLVPAEENPIWTRDLSHPNRFRSFIHLADGATLITPSLADFLAPQTPRITLNPPVDSDFFAPRPADPALREKLGLLPGEKVIVYHGSVTSANRADLRKLFLAVSLLNQSGIRTRLIRTGFNDPDFAGSFGYDTRSNVIDLGYIDRRELPGLLALADVLVQPGANDPFNRYRLPSKIPEFLSSGRPVIIPASNLGLQLKEGEDVLLLKDGSPDEIATACLRVFEEPGLADRLSRNAAAKARDLFDSETIVDVLLEFYHAIRERKNPSPWRTLQGTDRDQFDLLATIAEAAARAITPSGSETRADTLSELARAIQVEREEWKRKRLKLEKRAAELEARNLEIEKRFEAVSAENRTLEARNDDLDAQAHALTADRDEVRRDVARANQACAQLEVRLSETEAELNAMVQEVEHLNEREARVRATFSWRVTAPLRFLRRQLIDPFTRNR